MARTRASVRAFAAKKQPLGCFFLRFKVPWIKRNKLVDQTRN
jgi:hypothetical protein